MIQQMQHICPDCKGSGKLILPLCVLITINRNYSECCVHTAIIRLVIVDGFVRVDARGSITMVTMVWTVESDDLGLYVRVR